jgi:hypothetical protein
MTDVAYITIELKIDNDSSLMILLHKDGTINRKGDCSFNIYNIICMGITETGEIISELSKIINQDFEQYLNDVFDILDEPITLTT